MAWYELDATNGVNDVRDRPIVKLRHFEMLGSG
jgi:hypothetical protein